MARSRSRKKAPKKAPIVQRIKDPDTGELTSVRADGTASEPKRKRITSGTFTNPSNATGRTVKVQNDKSKVIDKTETVTDASGRQVTRRPADAPVLKPVHDIETAEVYIPSASEELEDQDVARKFGSGLRSRQLKDFGDLSATRQAQLANQVSQVPGGKVAPRKRKSMRVDKLANEAINTAVIPEAGTVPGGRPSAAYQGDGGSGGTMKIGRGSGAPLAGGVRIGRGSRQLRSKENIKLGNKRAANRIPKIRTGNYDPNASIVAGERPVEQLVREQKRGFGGKRFTELVGSQSSGVTYADTTTPAKIPTASIKIGTARVSDAAAARHIAKSSKAGYLQPGSIDPTPELPGSNTDEAKMARQAFFGTQARQHDINNKTQAAIKSNRSSALKAGYQIKPDATEDEAISLGAKSPGHGGLYGTGKDVKAAIALRDRYVRKYGHKLSDDAINDLPGVSREQVMEGLTPHAEIERQAKTLNYYLGENAAGDTTYNAGIEKTKIAEIAHHTGHKISHVAKYVRDKGIDVHQLHADLSEQVYDAGAKKKAWVPTGDEELNKQGITHSLVEYHPSGRYKSRRGRTASGANMPRHWVEIRKDPGFGPDAGVLTHTQYISHKISEHMETKPYRNRNKNTGTGTSPAQTAGAGGPLSDKPEIQTPFGGSRQIVRENEGPSAVEITKEGKPLPRGRAY